MKRIIIAAMVVLAAIAGGTAGVAAQSEDDSILDDFVDDESDTDWSAAANGVYQKISWQVSQYTSFSDENADQEAAEGDRADLQEVFNANNQSIENYTNARFTGNASAWNVIAIPHVRDDGMATQYIVADANNSTFSNAAMVNTTNRTVDKELTLSGFASDNAHVELQTFLDEFVAEDRGVTKSYVSELTTKYSGYVELPEGVTTNETA